MSNINELERLITFGRFEKVFSIFDNKYRIKMKTLTANDLWDVLKSVSGYDDNAKVQGMEIKTLARCITSINDQPVQYVAEDKNEPITEDKKIRQNEDLIGKWERAVVDFIYEKYGELLEEQNSFLLEFRKSAKIAGADKSGKLENKPV